MVVSIVTSFFILRENHRLNKTEEKYILLLNECKRDESLSIFIKNMEYIYSHKR